MEKRKIYDEEEETNYWFVLLEYYSYGDYYFHRKKAKSMETALGEQYRVLYSSSGREAVPTEGELNMMIQVEEALYDKYPPKEIGIETDSFDLLSFLLIRREEDYLIRDDKGKCLLRISKEGDLVKVMKLPERGELDYCFLW